MKTDSVKVYNRLELKPIKNGWIITMSGEELSPDDVDYIREQYCFEVLENALAKITELSQLLSEK